MFSAMDEKFLMMFSPHLEKIKRIKELTSMILAAGTNERFNFITVSRDIENFTLFCGCAIETFGPSALLQI